MAENVRVLLCHVCKSLESMPDYEGNPDNDDVLTTLLSRHTQKHPTQMNSGQLMRVGAKDWESPSTRSAIEQAIRESAGHTGFDPEFYQARDTLKDDAMTCWKRHNRTVDCSDYKTRKMLLQPGTKAERKAEGLPEYHSTTYVCSACPVDTLVTTAARKKAGMYK